MVKSKADISGDGLPPTRWIIVVLIDAASYNPNAIFRLMLGSYPRETEQSQHLDIFRQNL